MILLDAVAFILLPLTVWATSAKAFVVVPINVARHSYDSRLEQDVPLVVLSSHLTTPTTTIIEYDDFLPCPNPSIEDAIDVVHICMESLMNKSNNEGLEVCFNFSSDYLQAPFGGKLEEFIAHANNPVFQALVRCTNYSVASVGPVIAGTNTRGAMQTVLMDVQSSDSEKSRRFLWTMQKERRPPRQDCWLVHEVLFTDNAGMLTL